MRYLLILSGIVCLSFMLLPACAPQAEQQAEPVAQEAPSTEADMAAIENLLDKELAFINAGDVDGVLTIVISLRTRNASPASSVKPACWPH